MSNFGDYIRRRRKEEGMQIKELAPLVGVSAPFLSYFERAERKASYELTEKLATVFQEDPIIMKKRAEVATEEDLRRYQLMNKGNLAKAKMIELRIESNKTLKEISKETNLSVEDILELEDFQNISKDKILTVNDLITLGKSYYVNNVVNYLESFGIRVSTNDFNELINHSNSPFNEELGERYIESSESFERAYLLHVKSDLINHIRNNNEIRVIVGN